MNVRQGETKQNVANSGSHMGVDTRRARIGAWRFRGSPRCTFSTPSTPTDVAVEGNVEIYHERNTAGSWRPQIDW